MATDKEHERQFKKFDDSYERKTAEELQGELEAEQRKANSGDTDAKKYMKDNAESMRSEIRHRRTKTPGNRKIG